MLDLWKRYGLKQIAVLDPRLLPGPWTERAGRRALPLPVDLSPLTPPKGAVLRAWIDRGGGWRPARFDSVPKRIEGEGWLGDPGLFVAAPPELLLAKGWRKWRLGGWRPQRERPVPALPRPGLKGRPRVSILIPTTGRTVTGLRGPVDLVANCIRSIERSSTYSNYEILVSHNGPAGCSVPAMKYDVPGPFNLARKLNTMIDVAKGDYLLLLNDDTEVIEPAWLEAMLEFAQQPEVGAVGARLHYPDGRIQHAGMVFGLATLCGHVFMGHPYDCPGAARPREFSAVTGACLMIRRGERLDERFPNTFDAEICLRLRSRGLKVVYTPHARLFHLESVSLKLGGPRYYQEFVRLRRRWPGCLPDPFYTADRAECRHEEGSLPR